MPCGFDAKTVAQTALRAFHGANFEYAKMAGGLWGLRCPVETYFSAKVAEALWRDILADRKETAKTAVTLEESAIYLYEQAIQQRASHEWIRSFGSHGRVDVALWYQEDRPFGVIEVKRWNNNRSDLSRVCRLFDGGSSIEFGIMLFAVSLGHEKGLQATETIDRLRGDVEQHVKLLTEDAKYENVRLTLMDPIYEQPAIDLYQDTSEYALGFAAILITR